MASSPITSWQRDGEKVEMVTDFIFLGSRITSDVECPHEIKRCEGGAKKAEEQDGETTFSPTNSWKEQFNTEQPSQNNF